jgi:pyocin large subunit-like protein
VRSSTAPRAIAAGGSSAAGSAAAVPATLACVNLHHGNDQTSYDVSVVDDFNVGLSVTPHKGRDNCPVLACRKNLTETCPGELQLRSRAGSFLACKSGCEAFHIDEL